MVGRFGWFYEIWGICSRSSSTLGQFWPVCRRFFFGEGGKSCNRISDRTESISMLILYSSNGGLGGSRESGP